MNRRYKLVPLDERAVADMIRPSRRGYRVEVVAGIPEDATLERVWYDMNRSCFILAFSHPDWPEVPLNAHAEMLDVTMRIVEREGVAGR